MADHKIAKKKIPARDVCSICLKCFMDTVTLDCQHAFCHVCVLKCWTDSPKEASCPQCRKAAPELSSPQNRHFGDLVQLLKLLSNQSIEEPAGRRPILLNRLVLVYENDHADVSLSCGGSLEDVAPGVKDVQELKDLFFYHLKILRKEKGNILMHWIDMEKENGSLVKQLEMEREKVEAEFKLLYQFLKEKEKDLLSGMEGLKEKIQWKWKEQIEELSRRFSSLEKIIVKLEEKLEEKQARELLKDAGTILERVAAKEMFECQASFPPVLKWELWEMCDLCAILVNAAQQFKDTVNSGRWLKKANVTLNPNTAHPKLTLSTDRKSFRLGDVPQNLNDCPDRFDRCLFVLGREEFRKGRHYWDVTVGKEDGWGLGVARSSVRRKGIVSFRPKDGLWVMAKWGNRCTAFLPPCFPSLPVSWKPNRIRVSLNQLGRRLSFFDADTGTLLWAFTEAGFSGEPLCPFFWLQRKIQLSLSP